MSVAVRAGMNNSIDESIVWPRNVWRQFGMLRHMAHFAGCQQARQDTKEALQPALVGAFDATCDRGTVDESSNNLPSLNVCTATPAALLYLGALAEWHAENDPTWNANNGIRLPADVRSVLDRRPDPVARFDALFFETCLQRPGLLAELIHTTNYLDHPLIFGILMEQAEAFLHRAPWQEIQQAFCGNISCSCT